MSSMKVRIQFKDGIAMILMVDVAYNAKGEAMIPWRFDVWREGVPYTVEEVAGGRYRRVPLYREV